MGAAQHDGIYLRIGAQKAVDAFLNEVVGAWTIGLVRLYYGCPQRTSHALHGNVGE